MTNQAPGQRKDILDRLHGEDRDTGRDPPDQGHVDRLLARCADRKLGGIVTLVLTS